MSDLISRKDAVDVAKQHWYKPDIAKALEELPPAQPNLQPTCNQLATDTIDRQAAIDALKEHRALFCDNTPDTFSKLSYGEKCRVDELDTAISTLVNLPSAQPERKNGEWIDTDTVWTAIVGDNSFNIPAKMCSECKKPIAQIMWNNFCPNCGARMEV